MAVPALEELRAEAQDPGLLLAVLQVIGTLRPRDRGFWAEAAGYADDDELGLRNWALAFLGDTRDERYVPALIAALGHDSWSTRLVAARGLEQMAQEEGVGALCARMPHESGRVARDMAEILFRLTGLLFGANGRMWAAWWEAEGGDFEIVTEAELRRAKREREARRLKRTTRSGSEEAADDGRRGEVGEFFGIPVESHAVIFVLDLSGSMSESTRGRYAGRSGPPRIDVAKAELGKCLDRLQSRGGFNLIVFSGSAGAWREGIVEPSLEVLAEAKTYVDRLGAGGGTNLYDAIRLAFEDQEVDTIYILSDGEPSVGDVVDPAGIRSVVHDWNEQRGIVIHCIAVGAKLRVLEWLAGDSGGTYVLIP